MRDRGQKSQSVRMWLAALGVLLILAGCSEPESRSHLTRERLVGDPDAGRLALQAYGCGACHHVPGVPDANGRAGPPLNGWAERSFIAGTLPNEPEYLLQWIRYPQAIEPGTAMPNLGVTEEDARNIGAYLYTLYGDDDDWYATLVRLLPTRGE